MSPIHSRGSWPTFGIPPRLASRLLRFRSEFGGEAGPRIRGAFFRSLSPPNGRYSHEAVSLYHYDPRWAMVQQISPSGWEEPRDGEELPSSPMPFFASWDSTTQVGMENERFEEKRGRRRRRHERTRSPTKLNHATQRDGGSPARYARRRFSKIASLSYQHGIYSMCGRQDEKRHSDAAFAESRRRRRRTARYWDGKNGRVAPHSGRRAYLCSANLNDGRNQARHF